MNARATRINFAMVFRIMGWLLLIEAVFMLVPMLVNLYFEESDWEVFAACAAATALVGGIMALRIRPRHSMLGKREGFLLTAMTWVIFSIFGMLPFVFCETPLSVSDGYFEAMSGFTTTGATVLPGIEHLSHGIHLWRALMEWIGGVGIILFTLAVIPMLNKAGGVQMFNAEVTGIVHDKIQPRISQTAKTIWGVYLSLTVLCALLLWAGPMDLYEAICHSLGTVSTGGFSSADMGVSSWNSTYVLIVVTVFMFLGGVNFGVIFRTVFGNIKAMTHNIIFKIFCWSIAVYFVLFVISIVFSGAVESWEDVTIKPLFQVVSFATSTGYVVPQFGKWGVMVLGMMLVIIFFGACAGSTAGGAKLDRLLVLIKYMINEVKRALQPNKITTIRIDHNVLPSDTVTRVIGFLCLYCAVIIVGGLLLMFLGMPLGESLFSSLSCISNVGLNCSIVGSTTSFAMLPDAGKWVLSAIMLIGRLEIFTVLVLFVPQFWKR